MSETMNQSEEFSQKLTRMLNYSALNLATAIGYRLGIFEVMAKCRDYETCEFLAKEAEVSARYMREWLGVMACGEVVDLKSDESGQETYRLPAAHAACLLRGSDLNLGVYTQEIPLLTACAQQAVEKGFLSGEGVSWENYPQFQAFMAELADAKHSETLISTFLPSVDEGRILARLEKGIDVCDLGCGTGLACLLMAEAFPKSRFTGIDLNPGAIETARKNAKNGPANLSYQIADAALLYEKKKYQELFDYITAFDAIHDQTRPDLALTSVRHMLKPGGVFSMVDIAAQTRQADNLGHPMGPFLYTVSLMHCMPIGLNQGGAGLGMMWGRQMAEKMLRKAGFSEVRVVEMDFDPFNIHFMCRK